MMVPPPLPSASPQDMPHPVDELRSGVLEVLPDGFGFLRDPTCSFLPGGEDIYVSPSQIRKFDLRDGDRVAGRVRPPKESERYHALIRLERVNGGEPGKARGSFSRLTAVLPDRGVPLNTDDRSLRLLELVAPLGSGSRGLIAAPARSGATTLLSRLASALTDERPVVLLLVDARPEDLTSAREQTRVQVLASTFDEAPSRHLQVAELAVERARRLAEQGEDPVVLLDGLDRFDQVAEDRHRVRRLFGAGRCLREGGSLTLLATASPESACARDLRASATLWWSLDAKRARARLFPALDLVESWSSTRLPTDPRADAVRRSLAEHPLRDLDEVWEAANALDKVASTGN